MGSLALPGEKPGFVVAVGEELDRDPAAKKRHLWVVGEAEDSLVQNLVTKGIEFLTIYKVEVFCGDTTNELMIRQYLRPLSLRAAPYVDNERSFYHYVQTIQERLADGTLDYKGTNLERLLLEMPPEGILRNADSFPAIAALGMAISYIDTYPPLSSLPPIDKSKEQNLAKSYAVNLGPRKQYGSGWGPGPRHGDRL